MDKVYCQDCRHYRLQHHDYFGYDEYCNIKYEKNISDNYLRPTKKVYVKYDPEVCNKKNNCKNYLKKKFYHYYIFKYLLAIILISIIFIIIGVNCNG